MAKGERTLGTKVRPITKLLAICLVAGVIVAGMAFPFTGGLGLLSNDASDTVNATSSDLAAGQLPGVTTVTDNQGAPVAYLYEQNRTPVSLQQMSPAMRGAIVAIEDRRFYEHDGVDWTGTLRALVTNQTAGSTQQGASTLTQQYIKNYQLYVTAQTESERLQATEPTYARKLREVRVALQLERQLAAGRTKRDAKDEVLERYLNIVFLGNNSYGVAAAARTYFNTTPERLTIAQSALLAGMVQSTTQFDPTRHPQAATGRRNEVISQMLGQGMITQQQAQQAASEPLGVVQPLATPPNGCIGAGNAAFFCKYVVDYLGEAGISADQLNRGSYTIRTTLDRNVMNAMQQALNAEVPAGQRNVADVMANVQPGRDRHRVVAMGASRVFGVNGGALQTSYGLPWEPVNLGAGSVYKIFTAASALEKGLGINYQMEIPPDGYASPIYRDGAGNPFPVRNAEEGLAPQLSMTDALAQSPNTGFVKLMEYTGVAPVVDMAVRLGMRSLADPGTNGVSIADTVREQNQGSFTLGVTPTSPLELANVGATLGSSGMWCPPSPIESITDQSGAPVPVAEQPCEQVVDPALADTLMNGLGKDDQPGGTSATAAAANGWNRPMSGKTGTTQQNKSAAFVGFTQQYSGAVVTFDDSSSPRTLCDSGGDSPPFPCGDGNLFGGTTPARTWYKAMTPLFASLPVAPLPPTSPRYTQGGTNEQVPEVIGDQVDDATGELQDADLEVQRVTVGNRAPAGTVVGQNPRGSVLPDQVITLQVSDGTVPAPPTPPAGPPPLAGATGGGG
ncbi:putative bifunctional membrane-associated penicillin-binding protein PonA2/glycosyl transferase [Actinomycetospora sp. NBRC 106375]|uniref:transglycosylase domain-containing protein n=1 Tax=Actinomycetospora sp. NBRC 106375 TaxID=3032207 RepID=UPI0024A2F8E0|nr:transglycosylase domain-containing protein [Actinomycetospora sp. NBRC 106375]GLZ49298.1 putative bifunctional membrane-associated penicillin-binding protein PonA2/glycosyl transferase [Actinomycetospora sp. NBRC 106375]